MSGKKFDWRVWTRILAAGIDLMTYRWHMITENTIATGRNRLSAESCLGVDNRLGRLNCGAGQLDVLALLQPWHSVLKRFASEVTVPLVLRAAQRSPRNTVSGLRLSLSC